jgi:hypothetical protein
MDVPELGSDKPPLGAVIGSRKLTFTRKNGQSEDVHLSIGAPVQNDGTWWCPYEIRAQSFLREYALAGEDSLQALLASASTLSTELLVLSREQGGVFSHFGEEDLMLPTMDWAKREGDRSET